MLIQPGNWREHVIQSWNLRGARDLARELEGAHDAGNTLVQNIENL